MRALLSMLVLVGCATPSVIHPDPVTTPIPPPPPAPTSSAPKVVQRAWRDCKAGPETKTPVASLRAIDWCNHTTVAGFSALRAGLSEVHEYQEMGGMHDTMIQRLGSVSYADLDGDGAEEALVVIDEEDYFTSGAHSQHSTLYVYVLDKGVPKVKSRHPLAFQTDARVESGKLVLPP